MEKGSRRTGQTAWDIAVRYTQAFLDDLHMLGIAVADMERNLTPPAGVHRVGSHFSGRAQAFIDATSNRRAPSLL